MRELLTSLYHHTWNKKVMNIYKKLIKLHSLPDEEKHKYQVIKLADVIESSVLNIPFYKPYSHLNLSDLSYSEFQKLPVITKAVIRENASLMINQAFKDRKSVYKNTSGGSTGEPLTFFQTKHQATHGAANYFYALWLNGVRPYSRSADIWGAERDMYKEGRRSGLGFFLHHKIALNSYSMSERKIENYISILNKWKPTFMKTYVHSMYDISRYINQNHIKVNFKPVIHTTTGPLYPEMREEIKQAFNGAHIYSFYGSREVSAIATEVRDTIGMYVMYDNVFVEILNELDEPVKVGEEGEIVITTLNNYYMPLIRYRIGDRAIKGDDFFGSLRIRSVLGRTLGIIYKKDGDYIDGQFFTSLFFYLKGITQFQLIQKRLDLIELGIIVNNDFDQNELDKVVNRIKMELGEVEVVVSFINDISLSKTGKLMYVYSELNQ